MPWEELGTTTARVLGGLRAGNDNVDWKRRAGRGTVVGAGIDTARRCPAREGFAGDRREAGKTQGGGSHPEHRVSEGVSPRTPGASAGERLNPR